MNAQHPRIERDCNMLIAPVSKVDAGEFCDRVGIPRLNMSLIHEQCIRAIHRGDTYGYPPMLVEHCKKLIAEREPLTEVENLGPGSIAA